MTTAVAAIEPGVRQRSDLDDFIRRSTRLAAAALYLAALIVALVLVRPAFEAKPTPAVQPSEPVVALTDSIRKGESVATFAARHGLDLGELLALNPKVDSLALRPGTKLRVR
jgi:LysM repeat protein